MEILKAANDWGKAEIFSAQIFMLFGILFIMTSIGFWQLGKTEVAKAFFYPMLIGGIFLLMMGVGFFFSNKSKLANFETDYKTDASTFVKSEIVRTEKTMGSYENIAFKVFPGIIVIAALLIVFLSSPTWLSLIHI